MSIPSSRAPTLYAQKQIFDSRKRKNLAPNGYVDISFVLLLYTHFVVHKLLISRLALIAFVLHLQAFGWAYVNNRHNTSEHFYVYWICPFTGAILAAWIFRILFPPPVKEKKAWKRETKRKKSFTLSFENVLVYSYNFMGSYLDYFQVFRFVDMVCLSRQWIFQNCNWILPRLAFYDM